MKKNLITSLLSVSLLASLTTGCNTTRSTTTAPDGTKTSTSTSQSDNTAMTVVGNVVKIGGDILTAVIPPFIPLIVSGMTKPVGVGSGTNSPAK